MKRIILKLSGDDLLAGLQPQDLCVGSILAGKANGLPRHFFGRNKKSCHNPTSKSLGDIITEISTKA